MASKYNGYMGKVLDVDLSTGKTGEYPLSDKDREMFLGGRFISTKILWDELKGRKLNGLKFRRQHPLRFYIADFYCHEQQLVIEIDGGIHLDEEKADQDHIRTEEIEGCGVRVIRFTNDQIIHSLTEVKQTILQKTNSPSPAESPQPLAPSPQGEGE